MHAILQDLRHEARALARKPGFTFAAAATLALGIGANTTIFTIVNGVLLRPLPYPEPDAIVRVVTHWNKFGQGAISEPEFVDLSERARSFASIGLFQSLSVNLTEGVGQPELVRGAYTTPGVFEALSRQAAIGRVFAGDDGAPGGEPLVILSDALWRTRFGADPAMVGRSIAMSGKPHRVVGVMPPDFGFPQPTTRLWVAAQPDRANLGNRGNHSYFIVGRLAPGVTARQAQAEVDGISAGLRQEHARQYPPDTAFHFLVQPYLDVVTGAVRPALLILLGASSFVLLISCANVANLFLARVAERQWQIALRAAIGASAGRLVRQLVTGSLLVSALGGAGAVGVAALAVRALLAMRAADLPRAQSIGFDGTVLLFNTLLVVLTGLAVGLVPARRLARLDLATALKAGGRPAGGSARQRTRSALVVAEVALATVLLVGAGLLLRSFGRMLAVDPGFHGEGVMTARIAPDPSRYAEAPQRVQFFNRLVERLESRPAIAAAGVISILPLTGGMSDRWVAPVEHPLDGDASYFIQFRLVTPGYFPAMRIPILRGRNFSPADVPDGQQVALVSASLARRFWGDRDPIGREIATGTEARYMVVGVAGDVHNQGLGQGETPMWYRPYAQLPSWPALTVVARVTGPGADAGTIAEEVHALDPQQPVFDVKPMTAWTADSLNDERFNSWLLALLAGLAVLLSAVGLYAVISYSVSLRTQEIGIRMALGADPGSVRRLVMGGAMILTGAGLALGVMLAMWVTRPLSTRIYGVTTTDVPTYLGASALLALVALAATLAPALRATRVDPITALRQG